jgi:hypothetical protein
MGGLAFCEWGDRTGRVESGMVVYDVVSVSC